MSRYDYNRPPPDPAAIPDYLDEELQRITEALNQANVYTAAQLASVTSVVNAKVKFKGMMVWDDTNSVPLWASGPKAEDVWLDSQGSLAITPV